MIRPKASIAIAAPVLAIAALMAAPAAVVAAPATPTPSCPAKPFSADILRGPDQDLSLIGRLAFKTTAAGRLTGTLKTRGSIVPVSGSVTGRSLQLVFQLPSGLRMSGAARASAPITSCVDVPKRGSATGPRAGDTGRWGYAIGG
jgi:hypothetical protein